MASSAGPQLAATTVVLECLGEHASHDVLYQLCLVSKLFNSEFTRLLYRHIEVDHVDRIEGLSRSTHNMHLVKSFSVTFPECIQRLWTFNGLMKDILPLMSRLESLKCIRCPLQAATIRALPQAQNRLKHLHIQYVRYGTLVRLDWSSIDGIPPVLEDKSFRGWHHIPLAGFKNVQSLALDNMSDGLPFLTESLAKLLVRSPRLNTLDLSRYTRGYRSTNDDFFDRLAAEYSGLGGVPLPLRTLRCGDSIRPTREEPLRMLFDFSQLEVVHVENNDSGHRHWISSLSHCKYCQEDS